MIAMNMFALFTLLTHAYVTQTNPINTLINIIAPCGRLLRQNLVHFRYPSYLIIFSSNIRNTISKHYFRILTTVTISSNAYSYSQQIFIYCLNISFLYLVSLLTYSLVCITNCYSSNFNRLILRCT